MQVAVLGTGDVGRTLATRLTEVGHQVTVGSRSVDSAGAQAWSASPAGRADSSRVAVFGDAVRDAELVVNATAGDASVAVLSSVETALTDGVVVVDVANPLDFSAGMPPVLGIGGRDSLSEQIQRCLPRARVVKTLNTMAAAVMVAPERVPGHHTVFLSGDDADAKSVVGGVLRSFGWPDDSLFDLGGIETARGVEGVLPLWLRLWAALGDSTFNLAVVR